MKTRNNAPYFDFLQTAGGYKDFDQRGLSPDIDCFARRYAQFSLVSLPILYILDFTQRKYVSVSQSIECALGFSASTVMDAGLELIINRYHPDDGKIYFGEIFMRNVAFLKSQPVDQHPNFVFSYNYRFKAKSGDYHTILQRHCMIRSAEDGTPLVMASFLSDISDYKTDPKIVHTIDRVDGIALTSIQKNHFYPGERASRLSRREIELLKWICDGLSSKQIADKLHLSIHTVHNHRKNMLEKTNSKNVADLLRYAMEHGIL